jgi:hypothetical protein
MQNEQVAETLGQLRQAAYQMAIGFERAAALGPTEQLSAMREASVALIEMRRVVDGLAHAEYLASPTDTRTLTRSELRANADAAWCAGYDAHREGHQRHSPYAPES